MQLPHTLDPEIMAVVLPDGSPGDLADDFVATGTMLLLRYPDGRLALESVSQQAAWHSNWQDRAVVSGCFRSSTPILDPVSREVMGYEMEAQEWPIAS
ncbi:MAG: hypothetical protein AB7F79_01950 [Steroidobacteraceae bacterium]